MGVVEPVFPEVDPYPSYRVPQPILVAQRRRSSAPDLDRYVREALRATRTELVAR
jgi:hypothetical protein